MRRSISTLAQLLYSVLQSSEKTHCYLCIRRLRLSFDFSNNSAQSNSVLLRMIAGEDSMTSFQLRVITARSAKSAVPLALARKWTLYFAKEALVHYNTHHKD